VGVDLNTEKNTMPADGKEGPADQGRKVISGSVDLYFRTSSRILVLRILDEPDRLFVLKLAADPHGPPTFSAWQKVDYIADQAGGTPRKPGPGDDYDTRYRVERAD
jgi:hypothetical protein